MARKKKIEETPEDENFFLTEEEFEQEYAKQGEQPKQKGVIRLITKNRIIIVYNENGVELGTDMQYDPAVHSELKIGDEIEF